MSKTLKWILIGAAALIVFLVIAKLAGKKDGGTKVTAEMVKRGTVIETVEAGGKIYPETEVKVGAGLFGEVTDLYVDEGDTVKKGQPLARILTESTKQSPLRISGNDYSSLLKSIQAPQTTTSKGTVTIIAPIDGTISMLNVKKGERVGTMQTEVLRIADMKTMEAQVDVNENDIIKVGTGDSADVQVEAYTKRKFRGIVTKIAYNVARKDVSSFMGGGDVATYQVHIRLDPSSYSDLADTANPHKLPFRPGMNVRAEIRTKKKADVLTVPVGAVASRAKESDENMDEKKKEKQNGTNDAESTVRSDELEEVVFVINNENKVEKRTVTTGIQDINNFEITNGLKEGEKVVTGPYNVVSKTLRSGTKVRVVPVDEFFQKD